MKAPWRFPRWGLIAVAVLVAVPLLGACNSSDPAPKISNQPSATGAGLPPPPGSEPAQDGIEDRVVSWDGARTASTPRQLVLSFIGGPAGPSDAPCWKGYRPEVRFEAQRVVITLRSFHSPPRPEPAAPIGCTLQGHPRTVTVELSEDIAGRDLVDGVSGETRPVFNGSLLLEIGWRPKRWELVRESGGRDKSGSSPRWLRTYCPSESARQGQRQVGANGCFAIIQGPRSVTELRSGNRVTDTRKVREVEGRIVTDWRQNYAALVWTEGDQGFVVESNWIGEEVVQVARRLH